MLSVPTICKQPDYSVEGVCEKDHKKCVPVRKSVIIIGIFEQAQVPYRERRSISGALRPHREG